MLKATSPDRRSALLFRRRLWQLRRSMWLLTFPGPTVFASRILSSRKLRRGALKDRRSCEPVKDCVALDLQPGDWVEVRSTREISSTLDDEGKHRGLSFTREMQKFCGKRFRVYKRLDKIILEATGELRTIRSPTVLLEGVICDGQFHGGCAKSCFCFWRAIWLRRVHSPDSS